VGSAPGRQITRTLWVTGRANTAGRTWVGQPAKTQAAWRCVAAATRKGRDGAHTRLDTRREVADVEVVVLATPDKDLAVRVDASGIHVAGHGVLKHFL